MQSVYQNTSNTFVDIDYAALVYDQLLLYMKEKITEFYIEKNKNKKCILTFDEILEQIVVDYHEKIDTVAYQYFQVLRSIRDVYAEYPSKLWNDCVESNCMIKTDRRLVSNSYFISFFMSCVLRELITLADVRPVTLITAEHVAKLGALQ